MYENVSASQPTRLKNAFDSFTIFPLVVFFFVYLVIVPPNWKKWLIKRVIELYY